MLKRIIRIFRKDIKTAIRDAMLLYIIIIPIILAIGLLLFSPGITDSTLKIAMIESDSKDHIEYMENYVQVELFNSLEEIERRVLKSDDIPAIVLKDEEYEIIVEGNEVDYIVNATETLQVLYELGANKNNTTAEIYSFEKTVPPLKTKLVNMLILMVIMLAGMIISLGIVEEKSDNTVSAMNVSPVSQNEFIIGKSILGGSVALSSIIISLLILGYYDVNWLMIILVGFTTMILTFVVGFLQGISSTDVIEAAAGVKVMLLPIAGSIVGYEMLSENWQWTMYWSPFYWAYRANDEILSKTAIWSDVLVYALIVCSISIVLYFIAMPKIRKGLSKS